MLAGHEYECVCTYICPQALYPYIAWPLAMSVKPYVRTYTPYNKTSDDSNLKGPEWIFCYTHRIWAIDASEGKHVRTCTYMHVHIHTRTCAWHFYPSPTSNDIIMTNPTITQNEESLLFPLQQQQQQHDGYDWSCIDLTVPGMGLWYDVIHNHKHHSTSSKWQCIW